ncbi:MULTISPECIES: hypothetical protein [unclassified Marinitoga]|uniref:hypothetical protein n=1 Tax=unclassified Marinitoga TaxID=2640159 RepID=UPI0006416053|nr:MULTISPECIES: hypothetical protein [unclassified Marinitoga]KLO21161.1 hypothetical protein X274_11215 [Marinitoga sp. 1155]NUV00215.1 hypothetical protein [Marinitoga sp. 1154]
MKKYFFIFEIFLIFFITQLVAINKWFSILYIIIIGIEIYKDIFSKKIDEMERFLRYKTSNITLYTSIIISIFFLTLSKIPIKEIFFFYTLFPLLLKNLLYIGYLYERDLVIKRTGYTMFIVLTVFTLLSNGFTKNMIIQMLPWLFLLIIIHIAIKYRFIGSILFFIASIFFTIIMFKNKIDYIRILTYSLVGTPIIFMGFQTFRKE